VGGWLSVTLPLLEVSMKKWILGSLTALLALLITGWLAPSTWAMIPDPDVGGGTGVPLAVDSGGSRVWQVAAVVVIAVLIGAVGAIVAQRVRHQDEQFVSAA
jgi:hypothetical protein